MACTDSSKLHHVLHIRLATLAKFNPTSEEFKDAFCEGMFKTANQKGFYQVVYFLLELVDSRKCKEKLNWPLLDRNMEREFRKSVQDFIADVSKEDAKAGIPKITASMLHSPFGNKIVNFLIQLSQHVLQKQLKSKFNVSEIIHCPQTLSKLDFIASRTMMKILKKRIQNENEDIRRMEEEHDRYVLEATGKLKSFLESLENTNVQIKKNQQELKLCTNSSNIPTHLRTRIQNEDNSALEEWSKSLNEELDRLETEVVNLEGLGERISDFRTLVENAEEWKKSPPCLDRDQLKITPADTVTEALDLPVYNVKGELSLVGFINYAKHVAEELKKEIIKKYPESERKADSELNLEELKKRVSDLQEIEKSLDDKLYNLKTAIPLMQSKVYPHYEEFNERILPKNVVESPKINFQDNFNSSNLLDLDSSIKLVAKIKKKLVEKRKLSVLCSIKHKARNTSTKKRSKIPTSIKNFPKCRLLTSPRGGPSSSDTKVEKQGLRTPPADPLSTKPKKLVYPRSVTNWNRKGRIDKNKSITEGNLETPKVLSTTPSRKKRRSRISISPVLESIPNFVDDVSFTDVEQEVKDLFTPQAGPSRLRSSTESLKSCIDSVRTLENTSFPEGFESDSSLDLSTSIDVEEVKEEPVARRPSLQAIVNKYKDHKKKYCPKRES